MPSVRRLRTACDDDAIAQVSPPAPVPPAPALIAQLQRSAGNQAVTALLQRHLYKGADTKTGKLVDKVQDLPTAATMSLRSTHKGPVAEAVLEHAVTSPDVEQPVPDQHWDNPKFWDYYIGMLLERVDLVASFKPGDKLYGVTEARESVQNMLEKKKLPHPTIDTINNALGVAGGKVTTTGKDTPADEYAAWLDKTGERDLRAAAPDSTEMWTNIKRSCKAAIVYTTGTSARIHFELAGLNLKNVLEERTADEDARRITGVELRSIYRSFFRQANSLPEVASRKVNLANVIFYLNGKPVDPPWKWPHAEAVWKEYGEELTAKAASY